MRRAAAGPVCLSMVFAAACTRPQADPSRLSVAEVGGVAVSRAELEAYLEANLAGSAIETAGSGPELDRVKSRLLDNLLDEKILLAEADRRGVEVADEELDAWLEGGGEGLPGAAASDPEARAAARRELRIQKLREAYARAHAQVTDEEADAYVASHRKQLEPAPRPYLRRAVFRTLQEARRAFEALRERPQDFEKVTGPAGRSAPAPAEVAVAQAPPAAQSVLRRLKPGEASPPVEIEGGYAVYLLEARPDLARSSPEALRELARETLLAERYEVAAERFLEELRREAGVVIHAERLPFRYVPEEREERGPAR